jgi:polar amino acid transport system substrate-binding protein
VRLAGVAAATGLSAKNTAEQFGFAFSTSDYEDLLSSDGSHAVFIATRHDTHARLAADALRRGKSVFVEKPLALTVDELREVARARSESGGLLAVGYNRRFAPLAREIKKRLASRSGPMTIIYRVNAGQMPAGHWSLDETEGGGRVIGEACHFIDFAQYLTDALPARVSAESVGRAGGAGFVDDSAIISMSMTDGSIASVVYTASGDKAVAKERVEIFCNRAVAVIDDFKSGQFTSRGKTEKLGGRSQDKGHAAEVSAFLDAARREGGEPISFESLVATSLASFAAVESSRTGATLAVDIDSAMG